MPYRKLRPPKDMVCHNIGTASVTPTEVSRVKIEARIISLRSATLGDPRDTYVTRVSTTDETRRGALRTQLLRPERRAMYSSRRAFIGVSLSIAASALWAAQQGPPASQVPPPFAPPESPESVRNSKRDRAVLKANRDAIAKDVTRMSDLVVALQKQLKENDSADILSLDVIRKSEEIEKLAKHVRDLVRG